MKVYPRVCRGNLVLLLPSSSPGRSIPACAGEPHNISALLLLLRVYPRVCGGTNASEPWRVATCGLSPRVRGEPLARSDYIFSNWGLSPRVRGNP